jgi:hypothetical protein
MNTLLLSIAAMYLIFLTILFLNGDYESTVCLLASFLYKSFAHSIHFFARISAQKLLINCQHVRYSLLLGSLNDAFDWLCRNWTNWTKSQCISIDRWDFYVLHVSINCLTCSKAVKYKLILTVHPVC